MTTPLQQAQASAAAVSAYLNTLTPVTPPPVTPTGPVGIPIPPVPAGFTRVLSDAMDGTALDPTIWTDGGNSVDYNGLSGGTAQGFFVASHVVVKNGAANFNAYQDPAGVEQCWGYTAALAAQVNNWAGAGTHSKILVGPGSVTRICMKPSTYPGIAPMAIFFGAKTEFDFAEFNVIKTKGQPITQFSGSVHWNNHTQQDNFTLKAPAGVDFAQGGVFEARFTTTALIVSFSVDGVTYAEIGGYTFSAAQLASDILTPQNLCLQTQTGDVMPNPPADPSVTAANPVQMPVYWVTIDTQAA